MSSSKLSERLWTLICVIVVLLFIAPGVELSGHGQDVILESPVEVDTGDIGTTGVSGFNS